MWSTINFNLVKKLCFGWFDAQDGNSAVVASSGAEFKITDTKLYVPVVILSKENDTKLLEQLKSGFKRTIKWSKYRSQMTIQPENNKLNYLIDPTFTNIGSIDYFFCYFKELLEKIIRQKIIEILFHIIMYQTSD